MGNRHTSGDLSSKSIELRREEMNAGRRRGREARHGSARSKPPPDSPGGQSSVAALFEIGGARLVWQGIREHMG